ncbi:MAG: uroporphyrinogen-III C-methyltransferase [Acidaminococcaceae bacterium]|nr:uroporphyrinogen-III C-methyltransferase [Acidaminococcaceae bacterium]
MSKVGKVYLIGAGPGDPGLLGLKAKKILRTADTVVYDRLADPRILAFASDSAEKIYVGKASANHVMRQPDINKLLVRLASEGKIVARLKGGDPFVFGRGGEEAIELKEAGFPFEFIPGVTSAIAVAEYAGIPVTHRGVATSFAVITGHEDPTKGESSIKWKGLATSVDTLVFLMGVENIEKISRELIANGRSADCPAAVIRWGTHPEQRTLITTLGEAATEVRRTGMKPPAIFLVGEVVKLREQLRWFDNKPLFGKTVIVTRARAQASALTEKLEALGAKVLEVPVIKMVPCSDFSVLDMAVENMSSYKWLVFNSTNGVEYFFSRLHQLGKDSRCLAGVKIAAIGSATVKILKEYGLLADIVPRTYKAEDLADALAEVTEPGDKVLLVRAAEGRNVVPDKLNELGVKVTVAAAYQTVAEYSGHDELMKILTGDDEDLIVTFTSSSTVTNLLNMIDGRRELLEKTKAAVIGPITASTCRANGIEPAVEAEEFTIDGLVEAIKEYYEQVKGVQL